MLLASSGYILPKPKKYLAFRPVSDYVSPMQNSLLPFAFENIPVRGRLLRLYNIEQHAPSLTQAAPVIAQATTDMLAASALMAYDLGDNATVTLQIQSANPAVPLMVARTTHGGGLRAYAQSQQGVAPLTFEMIADGDTPALLAVTVDYNANPTRKNNEPYQSIVALRAPSVSVSLAHYFNHSVQLPTLLHTFTHNNGHTCGALFLQALPTPAPLDEDIFRRLTLLLNTLTASEFLAPTTTPHTLLNRLFAEDTLRVFDEQPLHFAEENPRARMLTALISLGAQTCQNLLSQGPIEMTDDFTGRTEIFTATDLAEVVDIADSIIC